jgi:hypothetical protein
VYGTNGGGHALVESINAPAPARRALLLAAQRIESRRLTSAGTQTATAFAAMLRLRVVIIPAFCRNESLH